MLASCLAVAACGGGFRAASDANAADLITGAELEAAHPTTVYEALQRLRPNWLFRLAGVFLDDDRFEVEDLRSMSTVGVQRIELVSASEATARWNTRSISAPFLHVVRR